jgi:hypothetical protein
MNMKQSILDYHHASVFEAAELATESPWPDTERLLRVVRVLDERYGIDRWDAFARNPVPTRYVYLRPEPIR